MTANDRFDTTLGAWLDEGPMDLPDVTRRAILTSLPVTQQARRGLFAPGRFFPMPTFYRAVALAAILVVAAGGAALLIGRMGQSNVAAPVATPRTSPTPAVTPLAPSAQPSVAVSTPSPLQGHTPTFVVPFSYRLPAGEGLVVDDSDPTWYQFRHPKADGQGYDNTIVVRAVEGGRVDPCAETSAAKPMANPQAFFDYFATIPTMRVTGVTPTTIDGNQGLSATVEFTAATAECPDIWLWTEEGSITQNGGRGPRPMSIVDVQGKHIMVLRSGPDSFLQKADEFIASIRFDRPSSSASPAP
jgi:hypothetical protein